jgi:hypothetical protein
MNAQETTDRIVALTQLLRLVDDLDRQGDTGELRASTIKQLQELVGTT